MRAAAGGVTVCGPYAFADTDVSSCGGACDLSPYTRPTPARETWSA